MNNDHDPRKIEKIEQRKGVLESARKLRGARKDIIDFFEKGIFLYRGNVFKTKEELEENKFFKYIENESKGINYDLFKNHFSFQTPSILLKGLYQTNDKENNNKLVSMISSGLNDLRKEIEKKCLKKKEKMKKQIR